MILNLECVFGLGYWLDMLEITAKISILVMLGLVVCTTDCFRYWVRFVVKVTFGVNITVGAGVKFRVTCQ